MLVHSIAFCSIHEFVQCVVFLILFHHNFGVLEFLVYCFGQISIVKPIDQLLLIVFGPWEVIGLDLVSFLLLSIVFVETLKLLLLQPLLESLLLALLLGHGLLHLVVVLLNVFGVHFLGFLSDLHLLFLIPSLAIEYLLNQVLLQLFLLLVVFLGVLAYFGIQEDWLFSVGLRSVLGRYYFRYP